MNDAHLPDDKGDRTWTRREALGAAGAAALAASSIAAAAEPPTSAATRTRKGRIRHSLVHWCYAPYFDIPQMIQVAKQLGCTSIELLDPKYYPLLKEAGLDNAIAAIDMSPDKPFAKGFNNPKYHARVYEGHPRRHRRLLLSSAIKM